MKNSSEIIKHFKSLSATEQVLLFSKLRIEFEGKDKGKLLDIAQKETSLKKCCLHCGFVKVHKKGETNRSSDLQVRLVLEMV